MKRIVTLLFLFNFLFTIGYAQDREITGEVTEVTTGEPLPGVSIVRKGTTMGATTDSEGIYSIMAERGDTLVFSFVGMQAEEVVVGTSNAINVALEEQVEALEEVVVTGYQTQRKADLTGAVSVVKVDEAQKESNANVINSLQGRIPGVRITSSGEPGGTGISVNIRGLSTINDNRPLYVIDGIPTKNSDRLNSLNPKDIKSIQVLKDAASASIYGARANNGVVVVTTKEGEKGQELTVNFDAKVGVQQLRSRIDVLNSYEWGQVYWEAKRNAGEDPTHPQYGNWDDPIMPSYIDEARNIPAANTDWIDVAFDPALMQSYNLGISNGSEKGRVYFSTSYMNQDGIMKYTGFERITARLNSSYDALDFLTIGENVTISYKDQVTHNDPGFTHQILWQHPLIPVHTEDGGWAGPTDGLGDKRNPLHVLYNNRNNNRRRWRVFGNFFAEAELLEGLTFKTNAGIDYSNYFYKNFEPRWQEGTRSIDINYLTTDYNHEYNLTWSNTLNYVYKNDAHSINAVVGTEAIRMRSQGIYGRNSQFLVEDPSYRYLDAGTGEQTTGGWGIESALLSYFGKGDYSYKDRYLASVTVRRDASSRLGPENRIGFFPAFAAGWRISEEAFMQGFDWLSNLKLRAGYGETGNQSIPEEAAFTVYRPDVEYANYDLRGQNTSVQSGYIKARNGNPNLLWETARQSNVGLDIGLLGNRVQLEADYFIKTTEGMLTDPPMMSVEGEGLAPWINAGEMENKGLEASLQYRSPSNQEFNYRVGLNFSRIRNKVISLAEEQNFYDLGYPRIEPGHPVYSFYGYVEQGLFESVEEIEEHALQEGIEPNEQSLGRIKYKDLNGDMVINEEDRKYIGNPHPDVSFGLNFSAQYRNFDFSMFLESEIGRDIYNVHKQMSDFTYWNFNYGQRTLDAWTPENTDTEIPAVSTSNVNNELRSSTYFVEDGSYLKIKSLSLGYTLPERLTSRLNMKEVRVFIQAQNLYTFENYPGMDVEIGPLGGTLGVDNQLYPHSRNINLGVNVSF